VIKRAIYHQLAITTTDPGHIHIPVTRDYLWVEQLTVETCVIRTINGVRVQRFELPQHHRNEALDCRTYARAVVEILRPAWAKIEERFNQWRTEALKRAEEVGKSEALQYGPERDPSR
jgi:phage terminase large subunit GpA-like protein